jgi:hypothetical protein
MDEAITAAAKNDDDAALGRGAAEVRDLRSAYPISGWLE